MGLSSFSANDMQADIAKKIINMKIKNTLCVVLGAVILASGLAACSTESRKTEKLEAMAKITRGEAEKIALEKVVNGTIKEGGIERENGKLIWSFDVSSPGTLDITEVQVDALHGNIVSVEKESPAEQAKEAKEKSKHKD